MPRAVWKGAVSFGLVNVPVRLHAATAEHDIHFHQVHRSDGGRIRMKRTCSVCGEEVAYEDVAKGYESPDGKLVVLTDEDLEELPVATGHEIDVLQFVPADQVDPILLSKPYYLEPESRAAKPYALLREALAETERMAVVKIALRQRESVAVLRVRDKAIVLQTMLWPDEVRDADFEVLETDVDLRPQELKMAASLVESLAGDFHPEEFEDEYEVAVEELVEARLEDADATPAAAAGGSSSEEARSSEVVDLLTALQRSVERARGGRSGVEPAEEGTATKKATAKKATAKKTTAKKTSAPSTRTATGKTPAKKTAAKKTTEKKTAEKQTAAQKTTAQKTTKRAAKTSTRTAARKSA